MENIPEALGSNTKVPNIKKPRVTLGKKIHPRQARYSIMPADIPNTANFVDKTQIKRTTTSKKRVSIQF